MASRPQASKGKRPPLRDRVAAIEPTHGYCPACGNKIFNKGAHEERCPGEPPAGWQCHRCWRVFERAGTCCGVRTIAYWSSK